MSGLTNAYVEKTGKIILGDIFLGTFPCDFHPKTNNKKTFCLVFNLSKHNTTGSHFVAIFASQSELIYFDPFGNNLNNKFIRKFIEKIKKNRHFVSSKKCIQSCSSIFCGFYCLGFLLSQKKKIPIKNYLSIFGNKNLEINDKIIIDFIQNYI
jgi:formate-dependent nitrite reductase membrane component NrfD